MDIKTIVNFLSETNDRLNPFTRTFKMLNNISDISEYIKINLKPNIKLEELGNELKVNIILINEKLDFKCIDFKYDKYICLIQNKNKYEFAYIKQSNSKVIYIFTKNDISNINLTNNISNINLTNNIVYNDDDDDDDEDYKEIIDTYKPTITIDESEIHTEEYESVKDIIKKELGEIQLLDEDHNSLEICSEENKNENKIVNGLIIPKELINIDIKPLKKMLKNDIINYFLKVNTNYNNSQLNKFTKEKLIEMIKN
jgi:hypothetical protein